MMNISMKLETIKTTPQGAMVIITAEGIDYTINISKSFLVDYFEKPVYSLNYNLKYVITRYSSYILDIVEWHLENDINVFPNNTITLCSYIVKEYPELRNLVPLLA